MPNGVEVIKVIPYIHLPLWTILFLIVFIAVAFFITFFFIGVIYEGARDKNYILSIIFSLLLIFNFVFFGLTMIELTHHWSYKSYQVKIQDNASYNEIVKNYSIENKKDKIILIPNERERYYE